MDSLSFPSRPLQKPRRSRAWHISFFLFSFTFSSISAVHRVLSFLILKILPLFHLRWISFCWKLQKQFPSAESVVRSKRGSKKFPISRSRRPALSSIARCPVRMTDLNARPFVDQRLNQLQLSTAITIFIITIIIITMFIIIINIIIRFFFLV